MKNRLNILVIIGFVLMAFAITTVGCKNTLIAEISADLKNKVDPGTVAKKVKVIDEGKSLLLDDPQPSDDIPAPANVVVKGIGLTGALTIEWSPVIKKGFDQTFYNVYKSLNGSTFKRVRKEQGGNTYIDTDVEDGVTYYYAVKTILKELKGNTYKYYSSRYSFLAQGYTLGKVKGLSASYLNFKKRITITWNKVPSAYAYKVERRKLGTTDWSVSWNVLDHSDNDSVVDMGGSVIPGTKYEYRVSSISSKKVVRQSTKVVTGLARLAASPEQVKDVTIDVRSSYFRDAIYLKWGKVSASTGYNIYAASTTENQDFTTPDDESPSATGKTYCIDIIPTEEEIKEIGSSKRYYRISALNEFGFEGQLSKLNPAKHYGYLLSGPDSLVPRIYQSKSITKLSWSAVNGATSYLVMKSESLPANSTAADVTTWQCQSSVDPFDWVNVTQAITLDNFSNYKAIQERELVINSAPALGQKVYYKVMSLNTDAITLAQTGGELFEWRDRNPGIGGVTIAPSTTLPAHPELWLQASNVISADNALKAKALSHPGNIILDFKVPQEFFSLLPSLNIKITRTYRYGGGHQGFNATQTNLSSHVSLTNPNPKTVAFSKTIDVLTLDPQIHENFFKTGILSFKDDLHDTNSNGEALYAAWNKKHGNAGGGNPWYEIKKSLIDESNYGMVKDPDGSPAGHEWHYLKWDWVTRKYMYNPGNTRTGTVYQKVDLLEAIRCDYQVILTWKESVIDVTDKINSSMVYGYPALTPREFTSLAFFIREVSFYKIGLTFEDEIYEMGTSADTDDRTVYGKISGSMKMWDGSFNLGSLSASANLKTSNDGISDFPGCILKLNWSPLTLKFGGNPRRSLDGNVITIQTPFVSGTLNMTADLLGGTYQHGVYGGDMRVSYNGYNNYYIPFTLCNEYGGSSGWLRAEGQNPNSYDNRYTSVGWKYGSKAYPGF